MFTRAKSREVGAAAVLLLVGGAARADSVVVRNVTLSAAEVRALQLGQMLDPALLATGAIKVKVCEEHLPAGSQIRANLDAALAAFSSIPGVAITLKPSTNMAGTHHHDDAVVPGANQIFVDYVPGGGSLTPPTAGVCPEGEQISCMGLCDTPPDFAAAFASDGCTTGDPKKCDRAKLHLSSFVYDVACLDPAGEINRAPSVGVFMHELSHGLGLTHLVKPSDDGGSGELGVQTTSGQILTYATSIVHGHKFQEDDLRGTTITAGTLVYLMAAYPSTNLAGLRTPELVAHPTMAFASWSGPTNQAAEMSVDHSVLLETTPGLVDPDRNPLTLRWSTTEGRYEPCTKPGVNPTWTAHVSETSTSSSPTLFDLVFETQARGEWKQVAKLPGGIANDAFGTTYRQIEWTATFRIDATDVGVAVPNVRSSSRLRFRVDPSNTVSGERDENNNSWEVPLCLLPAGESCSSGCP